jgi:hypothetical protein
MNAMMSPSKTSYWQNNIESVICQHCQQEDIIPIHALTTYSYTADLRSTRNKTILKNIQDNTQTYEAYANDEQITFKIKENKYKISIYHEHTDNIIPQEDNKIALGVLATIYSSEIKKITKIIDNKQSLKSLLTQTLITITIYTKLQ